MTPTREELEKLCHEMAGALEEGRNVCDCWCQCGYFDAVDEEGNAVMSECWKCASHDLLAAYRKVFEREGEKNG